MAKRTQKTAKRRPQAPGGRRRLRGMGISFKLALAFSLTITVLMALGGFILYNQAATALDEAIDSFGVTQARTLALQDIDVWRYKSGTYQELRDGIRNAVQNYPTWLQAVAGVVPRGVVTRDLGEIPRPDPDKLGREKQAIRAHDKDRARANARRLEGITSIVASNEQIDVDVVDVFIFDASRPRKLLVKANPRKAQFQARTSARSYVAVGLDGTEVETATEIESGTIILGNRRMPGRSFEQPIYNETGRKVGTVQLILSEDRVAARKQKLAVSCLIITLVMLAAGVVVSLVLAGLLSTPLRKLVDAVDAVAKGNLSHRTYGHTRDEIGLLALSVDTMIQTLREAEEDQSILAAREREMSLVADLRRNLLPNEVPAVEGFELEASYRPTTRVGGNYYDFLPFPDGRLGVLVADTAGEGVIAGFTMNLFRGFVHAEKEWVEDPVDMLRRVNRHLSRDIKKGVYVTAFLIVVEPGSHELHLVNAGHLPILRWMSTEKKLRVASAEGIALGLDKGPIFNERLQTTRMTLNKGDRVVIYTEGVFKIESSDGEELGEVGFNKLVARNAPMHSAAFMNLVERGMEKYREGGPETGDYTIITLKAV